MHLRDDVIGSLNLLRAMRDMEAAAVG